MTAVAVNESRLEHAREALAEDAPDWAEQMGAEELTAFKYAVTCARDGEQWTNGANTVTEIAQFYLGCFGAEYDVEWVESVVDLDTGEAVHPVSVVAVTVTVGNESATVTG